ncbi:MAG TPA: hypothetical protein VII34_05235, partial [Pyrinomonadaceae bacterium]
TYQPRPSSTDPAPFTSYRPEDLTDPAAIMSGVRPGPMRSATRTSWHHADLQFLATGTSR